jgi:predicted lipoprotein with Yx(FWY)xxD motif
MRLDFKRRSGLTQLVAIAAVLVMSACAGAAVHAIRSAASGTVIKTHASAVGKIVVDGSNHTLYMFARDKNGKSSCYGSCVSYWPAVIASGKVTAGAGIKASLLGTTTRKDGKKQVTYNKHPLYRYVGDSKAGQVTGQGENASGGKWYVVSPSGAVIKASASAGGSTSGGTTTSSGGTGWS